MHHKRKRATTRAELKRIDSKRYRMAESRAMQTGVAKSQPHATNYWNKTPLLPVGDDPMPHAKMTANKRPKKSHEKKCSGHEWYEETVTEKWHYLVCNHPDCPDRVYYDMDRFSWRYLKPWRCTGECHDTQLFQHRNREAVPYTITTEKKTCINCWEERVISKADSRDIRPGTGWRSVSRKKLKHRPQDIVAGMTRR